MFKQNLSTLRIARFKSQGDLPSYKDTGSSSIGERRFEALKIRIESVVLNKNWRAYLKEFGAIKYPRRANHKSQRLVQAIKRRNRLRKTNRWNAKRLTCCKPVSCRRNAVVSVKGLNATNRNVSDYWKTRKRDTSDARIKVITALIVCRYRRYFPAVNYG